MIIDFIIDYNYFAVKVGIRGKLKLGQVYLAIVRYPDTRSWREKCSRVEAGGGKRVDASVFMIASFAVALVDAKGYDITTSLPRTKTRRGYSSIVEYIDRRLRRNARRSRLRTDFYF